MVIAFKKRSENTKDVVSEGLHVYIISNLRVKNTRSDKEIAWSSQYLRKPSALQL